MLKHLFKLIWKRKKMNALMMFEIFFSFLILFAVWTLGVYNYSNYARPAGLETDHVWVAFINFNTSNDTLKGQYKELVSQQMKRYSEVTNLPIPVVMHLLLLAHQTMSLSIKRKK
ncbi:MAG: hypothetical protein R2822_02455 [Spirosomataceae bacterium]